MRRVHSGVVRAQVQTDVDIVRDEHGVRVQRGGGHRKGIEVDFGGGIALAVVVDRDALFRRPARERRKLGIGQRESGVIRQ